MITALWHMACSSKRAAVLTVSIAGKFLTAEGGFAVASVTPHSSHTGKPVLLRC